VLTRATAFKIDFKFDEKGILQIIDVGDGFAAGDQGFDTGAVGSTIFREIHEATGAKLTSLFGELVYESLCGSAIDIPFVVRQKQSGESLLNTDDLTHSQTPLLPCSQLYRLTTAIAYIWGQKSDHIIAPPLAMLGLEMHKILWYILLERFMPTEQQPTFLYWRNVSDPKNIDLSRVINKSAHGFFIKIADRSTGGGNDVYYAEDEIKLKQILNSLHQTKEEHIFIIEPAYMTERTYNSQKYNVTGRAFITLLYDQDQDALKIKIASAKWMLPVEPC